MTCMNDIIHITARGFMLLYLTFGHLLSKTDLFLGKHLKMLMCPSSLKVNIVAQLCWFSHWRSLCNIYWYWQKRSQKQTNLQVKLILLISYLSGDQLIRQTKRRMYKSHWKTCPRPSGKDQVKMDRYICRRTGGEICHRWGAGLGKPGEENELILWRERRQHLKGQVS